MPQARVPTVLFYSPYLGGGGAEMHLLRVLNELNQDLLRPILAISRPGGGYEAELSESVEVVHLRGNRSRSSTFDVVSTVLPLARLIDQRRPDLVFAIMDHGNAAALLASKVARHKPPLILGVQVNPALAYNDPFSAMHHLLKGTQRFGYHRAAGVIALSQGVADYLLQVDARLSGRVHVIPNAAVDARVWQAAQDPVPREGVASDEKLIVACGRLAAQKGYPYLLEALSKLHQPVKLWILGEGPDRAALTRQVQSLGLSEKVRFLGFQDNPFRYMAAADVFVLSSTFEGFGNVIVEAMAAGAPVVSTACDFGPTEIIVAEKSGLLVPVADPTALSAALERVLTDPELSARLRQGGRERARDFEPSQIARRHEEVFLATIARTKLPEAAAGVVANPLSVNG
ncbi:MAG: glycosyltransferase [Polyangiaceae bacterium]|nr:glycosyltransferase [Polyangiaceae bacterium]